MNHNFDLLSVGHFLLYLCFGYYIKHKYKLALVLGILWEIFEKALVSNNYTGNARISGGTLRVAGT